jgi:hypothetical protein
VLRDWEEDRFRVSRDFEVCFLVSIDRFEVDALREHVRLFRLLRLSLAIVYTGS